MKKKILFIITKSNWGGAQRYVYDLARALSPSYECTVALGGNGILRTKLETAGIKTISIPSLERDISIGKEFAAFFFLMKLLRKESYDIVHLNSSKAGGLGALAARLHKVPRIIFTAHGWPFNEQRGIFARGVIYGASWLTTLLCDTVISVSKKDYEQGKRFPWSNKKIVYIPLGIDISPSAFQSKEQAREFLLQSPAFAHFHSGQENRLTMLDAHQIIGTIGELHSNKGIEYGVHAIAVLNKKTQQKNYFYIVVGDGEKKESLQKLAHDLGVADQIFFMGFVEDAWKYLKAFDCFLLPSLKEGLPYVILEAAEASCPIVATTVGGIPDIVTTYPQGKLVPPKNSEEIAKAVLLLRQTEDEQKVITESSQQNNVTAMVNATRAVYEPTPTSS